MSVDCNGKANVTEIKWDNTQKAPFCNYWFGGHVNETLMQVWQDDAQSLIVKYQYAKSMNLRGLGPFQFGDLIWNENNAQERLRAQQIWSAFDAFYIDQFNLLLFVFSISIITDLSIRLSKNQDLHSFTCANDS